MNLEKQRQEAMRSGNLSEFYQQFIGSQTKIPEIKNTRYNAFYTVADLKAHFFDCCETTIRTILYSSGLYETEVIENRRGRVGAPAILIQKSLFPKLVEKLPLRHRIHLKQNIKKD